MYARALVDDRLIIVLVKINLGMVEHVVELQLMPKVILCGQKSTIVGLN